MHIFRTSSVVVAAVLFASAQAPVEEARPVQRPASPPVAAEVRGDRADDGAEGVGTLFYQLQVLQDEVRRLQGIVEEQNYRIERLVREQRERYVELDQRLLALRPGAGTGAPAPSGDPGEASVPGAASSQGDAYNRAFAVVTQARQLPTTERADEYRRALAMFDTLIRDDPNGEFTPNAYYWTGELRLALDESELARQAFAQVANLYGDHAKVPDALYKLGVTYHRLGDNAAALEHLDSVIARFPGHTAAGLARSYAAELR